MHPLISHVGVPPLHPDRIHGIRLDCPDREVIKQLHMICRAPTSPALDRRHDEPQRGPTAVGQAAERGKRDHGDPASPMKSAPQREESLKETGGTTDASVPVSSRSVPPRLVGRRARCPHRGARRAASPSRSRPPRTRRWLRSTTIAPPTDGRGCLTGLMCNTRLKPGPRSSPGRTRCTTRTSRDGIQSKWCSLGENVGYGATSPRSRTPTCTRRPQANILFQVQRRRRWCGPQRRPPVGRRRNSSRTAEPVGIRSASRDRTRSASRTRPGRRLQGRERLTTWYTR